MNNKLLLHLTCAAFLASLTVRSQAQVPGERVPGHYLVQVDAQSAPQTVGRAHGLRPDSVYTAAANGFAAFIPPGRLQAVQKDARVLSVVPDRVIAAIAKGGNKGKPDKGGGGGTTGQVVPSGVTRIGADQVTPYTGSGVGVAIVDTGLDFGHQDLSGNINPAAFDAFGGGGQDDNGHGTHVGGTVAAIDNTVDVVGVAPDATLYAVKVLDASGSGTDATVMAGLDWVARNFANVQPNIRVVNMSLGRPGTLGDNPMLRDAISALVTSGVSVVVAAGNDCNVEVTGQVPATYPEVMAIASSTALDGVNKCRRFAGTIAADTASFFTTDGAFSFGTNMGVTISAPGEKQEDINRGCFIKSVGILSLKLGGGTTRLSGTSMAAPHATGVVALLYQQAGGTLDPELARAAIMSGQNAAAPLDSPVSCYTFDGEREGVLSAPNALQALLP